MVPFGQEQSKLFFRIRVEVHKARWLRLYGLTGKQSAVHPQSECHGRRLEPFNRRTLTRQSEPHDVLAGELDTVLSLDRAAIRAENPLFAREVSDLQRLRGKIA